MALSGLPVSRGPGWRDVLVFRWAALAWMTVMAAAGPGALSRPRLAWACVGAAAAWTAWLTVPSRRESAAVLWFDLGLVAVLVVASGLVVPAGEIVRGRPLFASAYPLAAVLAWGVASGPVGGILAGAGLSLFFLIARIVNGVGISGLPAHDVARLANVTFTYLVAGGAVGYFSKILNRSREAVALANEELTAERERTARLAEQESMARRIHDSMLQAVALVTKRGRELAATGSPSASAVAELAELAARQEAELRSLILRAAEEAAPVQASLREALEAATTATAGLPVSISSAGPIFLEARRAEEIAAAVREALAHAAEHAGASKGAVFAEEDGGEVMVSVRDDGVGFMLDLEKLRAEGKFALLSSMKGRIEHLGGRLKIEGAPGGGTQVEFRVPKESRGV